MMDFLFFTKTFLATLALVVLMQVQVGERSIENHAMSWVQTSAIVSPLNRVAQGGAKVIRDFTHYVSGQIKGTDKKDKKEERRSSFRWNFRFNREQATNE